MERSSLEVKIKNTANLFKEEINGKEIQIISHFDTDGISSAAIIVKMLKQLNQTFSLKILKSLNKEDIDSLDKEKIALFLDLGSGSLEYLKKSKIRKIYIIDHHEITEEIPLNVEIINPYLHEKQKISTSSLAYLFSREIIGKNHELGKLAIIGMIGDQLEKEIDSLNHGILEESDIHIKKGLMIYPSTRPLNKVLEFTLDPFIPGVTGNPEGIIDLLRESNLSPEKGKYKSLIELTEEEMEKLVTSVILRNPKTKNKKLLGNLYLVKMFGKLEDAREISAKINACSRNGDPMTALSFCLENNLSRKKADSIHIKHKQQIISGLKFIENSQKISGKGFEIINAKDKIKDTVIGTITSILANSPEYEESTIILGMAYNGKEIKISARNVGKRGRNVREILAKTMSFFQGEVGGHEFAAGCTIPFDKEDEFIEKVKKELEIEVIKI